MLTISDSVRAYEAWLKGQLDDELVEADLETKHEEMRSGAFRFLRATCWRWAEIAPELLPDLKLAPKVLSVCDAHVENFGLWRDGQGRLVFGVNDFDEGAPAPYVFDLVRLTASAILSWPNGGGPSPGELAEAVLAGYGAGLKDPKAFILDFDHGKLRELLVMTDVEEIGFWKKLQGLKTAKPPAPYAEVLTRSLPQVSRIEFAPRCAGAGSLGRMRFVARAEYRGGPIAREAKALVPSCWRMTETKDQATRRLLALAQGPYRSPDPFYDVTENLIVRRLAPDGRKLAFDGVRRRVTRKALAAMACELGNIHRADRASKAIDPDLAARKKRWLEKAAVAAAKATVKDFKAFVAG
jgi:hypothetical protein